MFSRASRPENLSWGHSRPYWRDVSRHVFCPRLAVGPPMVRCYISHSTPEITREVYLHAIPEEQRRAVESVERLVFGPKWTQVKSTAQTAPARWN